MQIAIDGPVSAGKGTVSRLAAKRLGFIYVDTGALYRAVSVFCHEHKVDVNNETEVCNLINERQPTIKLQNPGVVLLDGRDIAQDIRTPTVDVIVPLVSRYQCVRDYLLETQRELARRNNVIMEGRDIGTFVLSNADLKIYLTAKPEVRAKRRRQELLSRGQNISFDRVLKDINDRDNQDMTRSLRLLQKVDDAVEIDTSDMTIEEVVDKIVNLATLAKSKQSFSL